MGSPSELAMGAKARRRPDAVPDVISHFSTQRSIAGVMGTGEFGRHHT